MARISKIQRSNNAHKRLQNKYDYIPGNTAEIKYRYHLRVRVRQEKENRILSKKERRGIFNHFVKLVNNK